MAALASFTRNSRSYGQQPIDVTSQGQRDRSVMSLDQQGRSVSHECPTSTTLVRQLYLPQIPQSASFAAAPSSSSSSSLNSHHPIYHSQNSLPPSLSSSQHSTSSNSLIVGHRNPVLGSASTLTRSYHTPSSTSSSSSNLYGPLGTISRDLKHAIRDLSPPVINSSNTNPHLVNYIQTSSFDNGAYDFPSGQAQQQRRLGGSQQQLVPHQPTSSSSSLYSNQQSPSSSQLLARPNYSYQQSLPRQQHCNSHQTQAFFGTVRGPVNSTNIVTPLRGSKTMIDVLAPVRDSVAAQATTGTLPSVGISSSNG
uniref:Uncharacterized protein n=1 Tax=Caenorhabditis japonica TaxID=281687 RepID=A0A8R1ILS1_CAEJA